jgi:ADP-ribose diphosphatase
LRRHIHDRQIRDKQIRDIQVLEDQSEDKGPKEGFLELSRLILRNLYEDGSESAPYPCDVISRRFVDAVTILLYQDMGAGRVRVGLRENLRAPVFLRRHNPSVLFPDDPPHTTLLETVAGVLEDGDKGEDLEMALRKRAAEECREEVGIEVDLSAIEDLGAASFPTPGIGDEKVYFKAVACDLDVATVPTGDGSVMEEVGGLAILDLEEALQACREGQIADMKTEIALARFHHRLHSERSD